MTVQYVLCLNGGVAGPQGTVGPGQWVICATSGYAQELAATGSWQLGAALPPSGANIARLRSIYDVTGAGSTFWGLTS